MSEGWIKLYRELTSKAIWTQSTPEQASILIALLTEANHKEKQWLWQGKKFEAKPGQFVTSLESILKKCPKKVTIQNIRTALVRFEKLDFLTNESTKTGRLITIKNWELYQGDPEKVTKGLTDDQQRPNKDLTPNKNDNNDKNEEVVIGQFFEHWRKEFNLVSLSSETKSILRAIATDYLFELFILAVEKAKSSGKRINSPNYILPILEDLKNTKGEEQGNAKNTGNFAKSRSKNSRASKGSRSKEEWEAERARKAAEQDGDND